MLKREFITSCLGPLFGGIIVGDGVIRAFRPKQHPKIGYISLDYLPDGTFGGDWRVERLDGKPVKLVQRAHDIEGWYEYTEIIKGSKPIVDLGHLIESKHFPHDQEVVYHVKAPIAIYYKPWLQDNPKYAKFKKEG